MKGLNLIILVLSRLSILGANDVQYVLPLGESLFTSRPAPSVDVWPKTSRVPRRPSSPGAALSLAVITPRECEGV